MPSQYPYRSRRHRRPPRRQRIKKKSTVHLAAVSSSAQKYELKQRVSGGGLPPSSQTPDNPIKRISKKRKERERERLPPACLGAARLLVSSLICRGMADSHSSKPFDSPEEKEEEEESPKLKRKPYRRRDMRCKEEIEWRLMRPNLDKVTSQVKGRPNRVKSFFQSLFCLLIDNTSNSL